MLGNSLLLLTTFSKMNIFIVEYDANLLYYLYEV